jgi:hypothetical protein
MKSKPSNLSPIKDQVNEISGIIKNNKEYQKAMDLIVDIFKQLTLNEPEIYKSNIKQVVEEESLKDQKYLGQRAIVLEWGNKIKPTEKEKLILLKRNKVIRLLSKIFPNLNHNLPESITISDYKYICYHFNSYQILFPHNPEYSPISIDSFINNHKLIFPYIADSLNKPNINNQNLKIGIDY